MLSPAQVCQKRKGVRSELVEASLYACTYNRILNVARTIAELEIAEQVTGTHISEAIH